MGVGGGLGGGEGVVWGVGEAMERYGVRVLMGVRYGRGLGGGGWRGGGRGKGVRRRRKRSNGNVLKIMVRI